jgi:hypothetical protein
LVGRICLDTTGPHDSFIRRFQAVLDDQPGAKDPARSHDFMHEWCLVATYEAQHDWISGYGRRAGDLNGYCVWIIRVGWLRHQGEIDVVPTRRCDQSIKLIVFYSGLEKAGLVVM